MTEEEEVLLRFSMKEAVYKAAHPLLRRQLGFKDVRVVQFAGQELSALDLALGLGQLILWYIRHWHSFLNIRFQPPLCPLLYYGR